MNKKVKSGLAVFLISTLGSIAVLGGLLYAALFLVPPGISTLIYSIIFLAAVYIFLYGPSGNLINEIRGHMGMKKTPLAYLPFSDIIVLSKTVTGDIKFALISNAFYIIGFIVITALRFVLPDRGALLSQLGLVITLMYYFLRCISYNITLDYVGGSSILNFILPIGTTVVSNKVMDYLTEYKDELKGKYDAEIFS